MLEILHALLSSADFFQNQPFRKKFFRNTIKVSTILDPDQVRHSVGPDLGPNCLQRLSADDTSRQRVNSYKPDFSCRPEECRHILTQFGHREITPESVARVLGMMARTPSAVPEQGPGQVINVSTITKLSRKYLLCSLLANNCERWLVFTISHEWMNGFELNLHRYFTEKLKITVLVTLNTFPGSCEIEEFEKVMSAPYLLNGCVDLTQTCMYI